MSPTHYQKKWYKRAAAHALASGNHFIDYTKQYFWLMRQEIAKTNYLHFGVNIRAAMGKCFGLLGKDYNSYVTTGKIKKKRRQIVGATIHDNEDTSNSFIATIKVFNWRLLNIFAWLHFIVFFIRRMIQQYIFDFWHSFTHYTNRPWKDTFFGVKGGINTPRPLAILKFIVLLPLIAFELPFLLLERISFFIFDTFGTLLAFCGEKLGLIRKEIVPSAIEMHEIAPLVVKSKTGVAAKTMVSTSQLVPEQEMKMAAAVAIDASAEQAIDYADDEAEDEASITAPLIVRKPLMTIPAIPELPRHSLNADAEAKYGSEKFDPHDKIDAEEDGDEESTTTTVLTHSASTPAAATLALANNASKTTTESVVSYNSPAKEAHDTASITAHLVAANPANVATTPKPITAAEKPLAQHVKQFATDNPQVAGILLLAGIAATAKISLPLLTLLTLTGIVTQSSKPLVQKYLEYAKTTPSRVATYSSLLNARFHNVVSGQSSATTAAKPPRSSDFKHSI